MHALYIIMSVCVLFLSAYMYLYVIVYSIYLQEKDMYFKWTSAIIVASRNVSFPTELKVHPQGKAKPDTHAMVIMINFPLIW